MARVEWVRPGGLALIVTMGLGCPSFDTSPVAADASGTTNAGDTTGTQTTTAPPTTGTDTGGTQTTQAPDTGTTTSSVDTSTGPGVSSTTGGGGTSSSSGNSSDDASSSSSDGMGSSSGSSSDGSSSSGSSSSGSSSSGSSSGGSSSDGNESGSSTGNMQTPCSGGAPLTMEVTAMNSANYQIDGNDDPGLTMIRGCTYTFNVEAPGHPFWIKDAPTTGTGDAYDDGVTGNGTEQGEITWTVPDEAPDTLFYNCEFHAAMSGVFTVQDPG